MLYAESFRIAIRNHGSFVFAATVVVVCCVAVMNISSRNNRWLSTGFLPLQMGRSLIRNGGLSRNMDIERAHAGGEITTAQPDGASGWTVKLHANSADYVFVGLRSDPWWKVSVDGSPVIPIKANGVFMAVPVTAGDHTVTFKLKPASVQLGMAVTSIGLLSALLFLTKNP